MEPVSIYSAHNARLSNAMQPMGSGAGSLERVGGDHEGSLHLAGLKG